MHWRTFNKIRDQIDSLDREAMQGIFSLCNGGMAQFFEMGYHA
jgi:hypothetical protein